MSDSPPVAPVRYGGQALIEGVMIRGPRMFAYAVRHPDGRVLASHREAPMPSGLWAKPFLRGPAMLANQLRLGWGALLASSHVNVMGATVPMPRWYVPGIVALALVLVLGFFVALPMILTGRGPDGDASLGTRLAEGAIKAALFAAYVVGITRMQRFKRLFSIHGAEHMAVHCHEAGRPLTVENVSRFSPAHPRCGTSFMVILMAVDTIILAVLPRFGFAPDMAIRVLFVPMSAGVAYELLRYGAARRGISTLLTKLGLATQRLTTAQPDDGQIEIAIAALARCQVAEEGVDVASPWRAEALALDSIPAYATTAEGEAAYNVLRAAERTRLLREKSAAA